MLYSLIALEKFAQTSEQNLIINTHILGFNTLGVTYIVY